MLYRTLVDLGIEVFVDLVRGRIDDVQVPFPGRVLWAPSSSGVWYADSDYYRLVLYAHRGEEVCEIDVPHTNPPISAAERSAFYEAADLKNTSRFGSRLTSIRARRAQIPVAATKAPLTALVVASQGDVWGRTDTAQDDQGVQEGGDRWHGLSPQGRPLGSGQVPEGFELMRVRRARLFGVRRDPMGVPRVEVFEYSWR